MKANWVNFFLIPETHFTTKSLKFYFPGYTAYRSDLQTKGGGAMRLTRK